MEIVVGGFDEGVWFVPDFGDNRSLAPDFQAAVQIKPLSGREKIKIEHTTGIKVRHRNRIDAIAQREWLKQKRVLEDRIVALNNWTRRDKKTGEKTKILTAKEFVETILASDNAALLDILDQIYGAIVDSSVLEESFAGE
jgi:hypothetical protein